MSDFDIETNNKSTNVIIKIKLEYKHSFMSIESICQYPTLSTLCGLFLELFPW